MRVYDCVLKVPCMILLFELMEIPLMPPQLISMDRNSQMEILRKTLFDSVSFTEASLMQSFEVMVSQFFQHSYSPLFFHIQQHQWIHALATSPPSSIKFLFELVAGGFHSPTMATTQAETVRFDTIYTQTMAFKSTQP